jgi:hypothetical protein
MDTQPGWDDACCALSLVDDGNVECMVVHNGVPVTDGSAETRAVACQR